MPPTTALHESQNHLDHRSRHALKLSQGPMPPAPHDRPSRRTSSVYSGIGASWNFSYVRASLFYGRFSKSGSQRVFKPASRRNLYRLLYRRADWSLTMTLTKPIPVDRSKIDMKDRRQVKAWSKRLQISAEHLSELVETVGNSAAAVRSELRRIYGMARPNGP